MTEIDMGQRRSVPPERDETLIRMWREERTLGEIAAALGIAREVVSARIHFLRGRGVDLPKRSSKPKSLPSTAWPKERAEELRRLYLSGLSASQIAARLGGVSRNAVIGKALRMGLVSPYGRRASAPGKTPRQIATAEATGAVQRIKSGSIYNGDPRKSPARVAPVADVTGAKPWTERKTGECAFPVGGEGADTLSCCAPSGGGTYCAAHMARMFVKAPPKPSAAHEGREKGRRFA